MNDGLLPSFHFPGGLLYPPNLCLLLLIIAVILALVNRRVLAMLLSVFGVMWVMVWSLPVTTLWLGGALESRYPFRLPESMPQADAIVVLGGNVQNNRANWFEPYNRATSVNRIDRTAALYFAKKAPLILVSGGALEGPVSDAQGMAKVLKQMGIPDKAILLEHESRNTYENAALTHETLQQHGIRHVLLVTSALHMPRAMAAFDKQNIKATAAGLSAQIYPPNDRSLSNCYELHFTHRFSATHLPYNALSTRTYFAYSEPYTYTDLCSQLNEIERRLANHAQVYFCRELLTYTLEGRRVELLTITSYKDIGFEREAHIEKLFPLSNKTL